MCILVTNFQGIREKGPFKKKQNVNNSYFIFTTLRVLLVPFRATWQLCLQHHLLFATFYFNSCFRASSWSLPAGWTLPSCRCPVASSATGAGPSWATSAGTGRCAAPAAAWPRPDSSSGSDGSTCAPCSRTCRTRSYKLSTTEKKS